MIMGKEGGKNTQAARCGWSRVSGRVTGSPKDLEGIGVFYHMLQGKSRKDTILGDPPGQAQSGFHFHKEI